MPDPTPSRGLKFGFLASQQVLIQLVNAVTGILLVRTLDKPEYAWLTIANTTTALFSVLVEGATGLGMQSIGSRVWQDRPALSRLVATALRMRWTVGLIAAAFSIPLPIWLLWRNACPLPHALLIMLVNVLAFPSLMSCGVLSGALKLLGRYKSALTCDLAGAVGRFVTAVAALLSGLNATTASLTSAVALWVQHAALRRSASPLIEQNAPHSPEYRSELQIQVRQLWPHSLFQYLQGQVSLWLISLHGAVMAVADFGALNRLAFIFSALSAVFYQLVIPALSRTTSRSQMKTRAVQTSCALLSIIVALVVVGRWLASPILWVLGGNYLHLRTEIPWMMAHLGVVTFSMIVWWFNTARGWIHLAWLNPLITVLVQIASVVLLRPETVLQIIQFSMITMAPSAIIGVLMTLRGFRLTTDEEVLAPSAFPTPPES
jgi:O-antigen/teichoic acid export membrane protein